VSLGFDHLDPGTPESIWAADPRLVTRAGPDLASASGYPGERNALPRKVAGLLVIAAHPDDESLGSGGLIASAATRGVPVHVIVATNGDASHPDSPTHTCAQLVEIRRHEVRAAVAQLDPSARVTMLDLPDGRLAEHEHELADVIGTHLTDGTLLVTPWSQDRHPDHEACARAGADAIDRVAPATTVVHWQYPIWLWHWALPDGPEVPWSTMGFFDLEPAARRAKARAVACHVSQHEALSDQPGDEAILPPRLLEHFARPFETFVVGAGADGSR
jgi:LmbE family N-acetylglucosaminyl deacetylase